MRPHLGLRLLHNGGRDRGRDDRHRGRRAAEALRDGQSIADVAQANGVDPRAVVDALVDAGNAALDEAVANGRIDEERAAELRAEPPRARPDFVDRSRPDRPPRRRRRPELTV